MDCSDIEIELDPSADERLAPPSIPTLHLQRINSVEHHVGPRLLERFIEESARKLGDPRGTALS